MQKDGRLPAKEILRRARYIDDHRLKLIANTIGTSDDTVKFHGIRNIYRVDFSRGLNISFDLDWNNQSNG